jgi:hypothetical protein
MQEHIPSKSTLLIKPIKVSLYLPKGVGSLNEIIVFSLSLYNSRRIGFVFLITM